VFIPSCLHIKGSVLWLHSTGRGKRGEEKGVVKIMEEVRRAILQGHPEMYNVIRKSTAPLEAMVARVLSTES
jgi:hypothetical protein